MTIPSTCITSLFLQNCESQSSNKTNPASRSIGHPQLTEKLLLVEGRGGVCSLLLVCFLREGGGCTQRLGLTWTFVLARCVLAGDHLQLPPTIISVEAAKQGLEVTLMERLTKLLGDSAVRMLTTQYRCVKQESKYRQFVSLYVSRQMLFSTVGTISLFWSGIIMTTTMTSQPFVFISWMKCVGLSLGADHLTLEGGGGDFWSSRIFFSSNLVGRIFFFPFFPISFLLHLCCMQCFSSEKRLQEIFF